MSTYDSDVSAMMQHLNVVKANCEDNRDEDYSNCQKPIYKRKINQVDIGDGRSA